jgi:hypothetical protein
LYQVEAGVQVLAHVHRAHPQAKGQAILLHGLEGSSSAGYVLSMAEALLRAGYDVQRLNMRSCGGTDTLCNTMYHAGLTSDLRAIIEELRMERHTPLFLVGFSLGGNVVLKLAGELGCRGPEYLAGVCAISTPIDLLSCVRALGRRENRIYDWRFVRGMLARMRARDSSLSLTGIRTVYEFDDRVTARAFGFGCADHYYRTQSAIRFLPMLRVPAVLIASKDDPLVPFGMYERDEVRSNACIEVLALEHGGHLGFISRTSPRFWLDTVVVNWLDRQRDSIGAK